MSKFKEFFNPKRNIKFIKNIKTKYNYEDLLDQSMAVGCLITAIMLIVLGVLTIAAIAKFVINYLF